MTFLVLLNHINNSVSGALRFSIMTFLVLLNLYIHIKYDFLSFSIMTFLVLLNHINNSVSGALRFSIMTFLVPLNHISFYFNSN